MTSDEMLEQLKASMGFGDYKSCRGCRYVAIDPTFDEFSKGDYCVRNPDMVFSVAIDKNTCDKWEAET